MGFACVCVAAYAFDRRQRLLGPREAVAAPVNPITNLAEGSSAQPLTLELLGHNGPRVPLEVYRHATGHGVSSRVRMRKNPPSRDPWKV